MGRAFVITWLALGVAGALNHTVLDRRFDLLLPHLKYGHVMFNKNPRKVQRFWYAGADSVRHDLADLMPMPALGYRRARLAITVATNADYLMEVCLHQRRNGNIPLTFTVEEVDLDSNTKTDNDLHCDAHGLH